MSTNRLNHNYLLLNIYSGIDSPVDFDSILTSITILPIAYNRDSTPTHVASLDCHVLDMNDFVFHCFFPPRTMFLMFFRPAVHCR